MRKFLRSFWIAALSLLTVLNVTSSFAADEASLTQKFSSEILPYFEASRKGSFNGKDGVPIAWRAFPPSNGGSFQGARALVILNGRTEFMRKYAELVYDLQNRGYAIYLMDHRGQGESGRMLPEPRLGYVKSFRDYVDDFGTFLKEVVLKDGPSEVHVLAHSMGGAVATAYAQEHPHAFRSMVLTAPMYQPNLGNYSECLALTIADFMKLIRKSPELAPGRALDEWKTPFETNHVTHSRARFGYSRDLLQTHPDNAVGGPTYRWVEQSILGGKRIRKNANKLTTPVRILQAGDEQVVKNVYESDICGKAKACDLQVIDGAKHELLMESDDYRNRAIAYLMDWLNQHSASP